MLIPLEYAYIMDDALSRAMAYAMVYACHDLPDGSLHVHDPCLPWVMPWVMSWLMSNLGDPMGNEQQNMAWAME